MAESFRVTGKAEAACFFDEPCEKLQEDKEMRRKAEIMNSRFFMMSIFIVLIKNI